MAVLAENYVVLDVETNGLSSLRDDLLSISIYQPDTQKMYNKYLPLELNRDVYTTHINGITKKTLKKATPLTQQEVDELFVEFDLLDRTILTYGSLDERFIKNYFKRKQITGFELLRFFNFKRNIISSRFSGGNITKDNLCQLYGIDGVSEQHTGTNDCLLEWKLFEKMNGNKLLITNDRVYEFNNDYIVPVSYISAYPNFKYHIGGLPNIKCLSSVVERFDVSGKDFKKFPTNFNGMIIEHLINTMLNVDMVDSRSFLVENKKKLNYIGTLPSAYDEVLLGFNPDGSVSAVDKKDKVIAEELNEFLRTLKESLAPLVDYVASSIFHNERILSQELVVHNDRNILALCDLSNRHAVLEIKASSFLDMEPYANQLYYESNGRPCYIMQIDWSLRKKKLGFLISKVDFVVDTAPKINSMEARIDQFKKKLNNDQVDVVNYVDSNSKVTLSCKVCKREWTKSYDSVLKNSKCPYCNPLPSASSSHKKTLSEDEKRQIRTTKFVEKVKEKSGGEVVVFEYNGAKENVRAKCLKCGHQWLIRADHLLSRSYCPVCRKNLFR